MSDETPEAPASTTRRDLIKKAGVGAAVVWTAPIVMSLGSVAAAASPGGVACADCRRSGLACAVAQPCGDPSDGCNCWLKADGSGNCCGFFAPFCTPENACASDGSCPVGYTCVGTCCGNICVAPCGSGLPPLEAQGFGAQAAGPSTVMPAE